jgi:hypothetical protein
MAVVCYLFHITCTVYYADTGEILDVCPSSVFFTQVDLGLSGGGNTTPWRFGLGF